MYWTKTLRKYTRRMEFPFQLCHHLCSTIDSREAIIWTKRETAATPVVPSLFLWWVGKIEWVGRAAAGGGGTYHSPKREKGWMSHLRSTLSSYFSPPFLSCSL